MVMTVLFTCFVQCERDGVASRKANIFQNLRCCKSKQIQYFIHRHFVDLSIIINIQRVCFRYEQLYRSFDLFLTLWSTNCQFSTEFCENIESNFSQLKGCFNQHALQVRSLDCLLLSPVSWAIKIATIKANEEMAHQAWHSPN